MGHVSIFGYISNYFCVYQGKIYLKPVLAKSPDSIEVLLYTARSDINRNVCGIINEKIHAFNSSLEEKQELSWKFGPHV